MIATKPTPAPKPANPYWEKFEQFEREVPQPLWLVSARNAGMSRFAELGFPTLQDEDWRFTNVAPIARLPFKPLVEATPHAGSVGALERFAFTALEGSRLVFVNGHFAPELSATVPQSDGTRIGSLAAALVGDTALLEKHLTRYARTDDNAFAALNTAFFTDGAFIHVPAGRAVAGPIHLLFLSTSKEAGATAHPRNLIVAEKGSQVTIVESYVRAVDAPVVTNAVTELIAGEGAIVEHCKFQDESQEAFHLATVQLHCSRRAKVVAHSIAIGAKLSRNNINTTLAGEGIECILNGLYLTKGEQLADHHMVVDHAQPNCASHEYYNGILEDRSKGVFHGRILVRPAAQKTDAKQTNKNLLLSDDATIDTKPQLEIYADDVKCTHGATIGQLNDESIFYLRARGIGPEMARRMLIHAFAGEIIDRVRCEPLRGELDKLVWDRLEENERIAVKK